MSESISRALFGQWDDILMAYCRAEPGAYCSFDLCREVEMLVKPHQGLSSGASGGAGWCNDSAILWDLYQVCRNRLAWDRAIEEGKTDSENARNWSTMMQVHYDEPMKTAAEPLAKLTRVDRDTYQMELSKEQALVIKQALVAYMRLAQGDFVPLLSMIKCRDGSTLQSVETINREIIALLGGKENYQSDTETAAKAKALLDTFDTGIERGELLTTAAGQHL